MGEYNWKQHFAGFLKKINGSPVCQKWHLKNETGEGWITVWSVLPGVQVMYTDLHMLRCSQPVKPCKNIIEINYCVEGRYECDVNNQYSFYVAPGDFSVGTVGRKEARGSFPTGRFSGISFFLDLSVIANKKTVLQELKINLDTIRSIANTERRYLVLNRNERIDGIFNLLIHVTKEDQISLLRLKAVEGRPVFDRHEYNKYCDSGIVGRKRTEHQCNGQ